jgi:hypothetical protein
MVLPQHGGGIMRPDSETCADSDMRRSNQSSGIFCSGEFPRPNEPHRQTQRLKFQARPVHAPLPTICGNRGDWAVAGAILGGPFIVPIEQADDQLTSKVIAYLVKYFKTGIAKSVEPQAKILPVLQDKVVTPVGGQSSYQVNIRIADPLKHRLEVALCVMR